MSQYNSLIINWSLGPSNSDSLFSPSHMLQKLPPKASYNWLSVLKTPLIELPHSQPSCNIRLCWSFLLDTHDVLDDDVGPQYFYYFSDHVLNLGIPNKIWPSFFTWL